MLRWRVALGILIVGVLLGLCWFDHWLENAVRVPGLVLLPLGLLCSVAATGEILDILAAGDIRPRRRVVYTLNVLIMLISWGACIWRDNYASLTEHCLDRDWLWSATACVWTMLALAGGVIFAFVTEMRKFEKPGHATINLAGAVFAMAYIGMMMGFLVQIRMAWGVTAVLSLIVVVKMTDTGAYTIGRLFGRNKMAPGLSPGKTIEGAFGGLAFACIGSWAIFYFAGSDVGPAGWISYGLVIGLAGMAGDLAESLLKRDAKQKDSSRWMPGFGGVLDIIDSILLAAPVAYAWWAFDLVWLP